jgi:hypothetical protein
VVSVDVRWLDAVGRDPAPVLPYRSAGVLGGMIDPTVTASSAVGSLGRIL